MSINYKTEILECMPIGLELTTQEILSRYKPSEPRFQHAASINRVYNALIKLQNDGYVTFIKKTLTETNGKVNVWVRTR